MSRTGPPVRWIAVAAAVLFTAVALGGLLRGGEVRPAAGDDPHGGVGRAAAPQLDRVLHAAQTTAGTASQQELVAQGRALFRDTALAKMGESCQTCHTEGGGADFETGVITHPRFEGDFTGPRDVPSLWGVGQTAPYGWEGRTQTLEAFVAGTILDHFRDGRTQSDAATGGQVAALTAYLRSLQPPRTDFDRGTLSAAARRGEDLFVGKAGCMACHGGPLLTHNDIQVTGVPGAPGDTDPGAAKTGALKGAFNTPQLRDVRNTAPYMHNGSIKTLREVIEHYDQRSPIAPLRLTPGEIDDLVAYLESL